METGLQALLLCSDDAVVRVVRRVLSEMEVAVEHCSDSDSAVQRLTRQRFEAVVVDCASQEVATRILKGARSAPANKRAITVAVLESEAAKQSQMAVTNAFELGAHFVLFKPLSLERTRASFRAVRALMKRERRRHARIPIQIPVELKFDGSQGSMRVTSADLGENGIAVKANRKAPGPMRVCFTLPGSPDSVECRGEVAWEGNHTFGIRFRDVPPETSERLQQWIGRQLMNPETDEISISCRLTDLSLNACYLQTESPFPVRTRLTVTMKAGGMELQIEGLVRVMHPAKGMGVEFAQNTAAQRSKVEEFIQTLVNTADAIPDLQVRPEGIDNSAAAYSSWETPAGTVDPLLSLFRSKAELPADVFHLELKKQRGAPAEVTA